MTKVRDLVASLAKSGETANEIMGVLEKCFGPNAMSRKQVYSIIRCVKEGQDTKDRRGKHNHKTLRTEEAISRVKAAVAADPCYAIQDIASIAGLKSSTTQRILKEDLGLIRKKEQWVPKTPPPYLNEPQV